MKVLLVDDHPMVRDGVRAALVSAGIDVVAEAGSVAEAVSALQAKPDVVLMDLQLPDGSGIDATRTIVALDTAVRVIVLTMTGDDDAVFAALAAGAHGYLLKGADRATIIAAVTAVERGEAVLGAGVAMRVLEHFIDPRNGRPPPLPELSDREREVLALVAEGLTNSAIAERLFVSPKTVRNHVSNILMKLHVPSRTDAARRAREAGM
jgi:DNA-binding NarL/FixJ family response regulator